MSGTTEETASFIKNRTGFEPEVGIILGTGLGGMVSVIDRKHSIDYESIPNFPVSTVEGHHGRLIFGMLEGKKVVAMQGRFHYYEGYTTQQVCFPVRVMKHLGISSLFVSNASGGINPDFKIGDLMVLTDHINLIPNPLIGPHDPELGPRFPDMSDAYDQTFIERALDIARKARMEIRTGTYVAVTGPTLETPAEYAFMRTIGGDAVGMSTVPEIIAARQMGIRCFAVSIITDLGIPGRIIKVSLEDVQKAAEEAEPGMTFLLRKLIGET